MANFKLWEKISNTGLSDEEIQSIIDACRIIHGNKMSIGTACGLRAGFRALGETGVARGEHAFNKIIVRSNPCAALAFGVVTGLNPLKKSFTFECYMKPDWESECTVGDKTVYIKMRVASFETPEDALNASDEEIFDIVEVR